MQNRLLATWLTQGKYESFESDRQSQQKIREELRDKPDELKPHEDKLGKEPPSAITKRSVFAR